MTDTSANNGGPAAPTTTAPRELTKEPGSSTAKQPGPKKEGTFLNSVSHIFLVVWGLLVTLPLVWAVMNAVKTDKQILTHPWALPTSLHLDSFVRAWSDAHLGRFFGNTLLVMAGSLTGTMLFGAMTAYVLARFDFPGNRFIYYLLIAGMAFPIFMAMVPLFGTMKTLGLLNTYPGLMIAYIGYSLPFTVFFLTAFFRTLPTSIAEAALIDGASHTRTFFQVMLPLAKPGLISLTIFNFLGQWNQYLLPLVLMQGNEKKQMLTQGLASLAIKQGYKGDWSGLFAGLTVAMLPVLLVYIVFQRQVQAGLTAGAMK